MRSLFALVCLLVMFSAPLRIQAEPDKQEHQSSEFTFKINYLVHRPADYDKEKEKKWPVLVFLHGSGERGDNLDLVKVHGPPMLIAKGQDLPFIVVSPQCPTEQFWNPHLLKRMLDEVVSKNRADESRIYLTGLSMGGYGAWDWAQLEPKRFAAIVPICGGGNRLFARRLRNIPVWVFHGAKDTGVPLVASTEMVDAIKEAGGNPKLTVYPELEHDCWTVTYDNPELYKWLLEQKLPATEPKPAK